MTKPEHTELKDSKYIWVKYYFLKGSNPRFVWRKTEKRLFKDPSGIWESRGWIKKYED